MEGVIEFHQERFPKRAEERMVDVPIPPTTGDTVEVDTADVGRGSTTAVEVSAPQTDEQTLEQIEYATLAPILDTFPHEKCHELCRIVDLKHAELRQAELVVQRGDLHAAITGHACDAEAASEARKAYGASEVIVENIQRQLGVLRALPPLVKPSSLSTRKTLRLPQGKRVAQTLTSMSKRYVWTEYKMVSVATWSVDDMSFEVRFTLNVCEPMLVIYASTC